MSGNQNQTFAVITGASGGLGKAMAREFLERGACVIGVSRSRPEGLEGAFHWIQADITVPADRERLAAEVNAICGGRLDLLINNAGKGIYATWEEMREEDLRAVFELDFFAPAALTKRLLPQLAAAHGTVVNISSAASRIWVPCMGAYCAVKAALAMFSNSLGPEIRKYGIRVLDVAPGQINTGFSSRSCGKRRPPDSPGAKGHSPAGLAKAVFRAWKKGKRRITYPGTLGAAIWFVRVFLPGLYDRINRKLWKLD